MMKILVIRKRSVIISVSFLIFFLISIPILMKAGIAPDATGTNAPMYKNGSGGKLAIILDDFGQDRKGVKEILSINRHLTFAVMPFLTYSVSDAKKAHEKGFEVIVHLPMEATGGELSWVGPRPILTGLSDTDVKKIVDDSFKSIPYAVGANIHMGSKASTDKRVVSSILEVVRKKGVYFVDSLTVGNSVAKEIADRQGVLCYDRDVFLDVEKSKPYIKKQLREAERIALKRGYAIAIGHVGIEGGKVTAEAIAEMLGEFDRNKVQLVFVSELPKH